MWLKLFLVIQIVFMAEYSAGSASPVRVVTYGVPCPPSCYLPYDVEIPLPVTVAGTGKGRSISGTSNEQATLNKLRTIDTTYQVTDHVGPEIASQFVRYPFAIQIPQPEVTTAEENRSSSISKLKSLVKQRGGSLKTTVDTVLVPACQDYCI